MLYVVRGWVGGWDVYLNFRQLVAYLIGVGDDKIIEGEEAVGFGWVGWVGGWVVNEKERRYVY